MESWLSLGLRIWGQGSRGLRIGAPISAPSQPQLLGQVDKRVQAVSLLGGLCPLGAVGLFRCLWMHLRDPEAQVGSSLG